MKLLKFSISSHFGMFKKANNWQDNKSEFNFHSYLFPHIPFITGLLGAAYGFKGYQQYKSLIKTIEDYSKNNPIEKLKKEIKEEQKKKKVDNNKIKTLQDLITLHEHNINEILKTMNNFELDFYTYLKDKIHIGIEVHHIPITNYMKLSNTQRNGIACSKGTVYNWTNEVIENPTYSFYIYSEEEPFINTMFEKLNNPYYTLKMGKNRYVITEFEVQNIDSFTLLNETIIPISSNILIKEKEIEKNSMFISVSDTIPFSYSKINHDTFEKCLVFFDKKGMIKVNKNSENIYLSVDNKNIVLYKV